MARSANPELDRMEGYFAWPRANKKHSPDIYDDFGIGNDGHSYYYQPGLNPGAERTKAFVIVGGVIHAGFSKDIEKLYAPCAISGGLLPNEIVARENRARRARGRTDLIPSTYKLERHIGSDRVKLEVRDPNTLSSLVRGQLIRRQYPDVMAILPAMHELAVREFNNNPSLSNRQRYEEEDFMGGWYPIIDSCKYMVLDGDWHYSRNSNWEMMRGILIQAGFFADRPHADMDVLDIEKNQVSLLWRAEKMAEALRYYLGKGLDPREAATVLARIFDISDRIEEARLGHGRDVHPVLLHRPKDELAEMNRLKREFEPLLMGPLSPYLRGYDLPKQYLNRSEVYDESRLIEDEKIIERYRDDSEEISERAGEITSPVIAPILAEKYRQDIIRVQRNFDPNRQTFSPATRSYIFDDDLYGKCHEWEEAALPYVVGEAEVGAPPYDAPLASFIFFDPKRGAIGAAAAKEAGVADMAELAGALGQGIETVQRENVRVAEAVKASIQRERPGEIIINSPSFGRIFQTIDKYRAFAEDDHFVAAGGPSKNSANFRLAFMMKALDRSVGEIIFQDGWENSNDGVALRVRARLIQAGLVPRPFDQGGVKIYTASTRGVPDSLLTDVTLLTREVKRCVDAGVDAPEQALGLLRLTILADMIADPRLAGPFINPLEADVTLTGYHRAEMRKIVFEAKELLRTQALRSIPRERLESREFAGETELHRQGGKTLALLMSQYIKWQDDLLRDQELKKLLPKQTAVHVVRRGLRV